MVFNAKYCMRKKFRNYWVKENSVEKFHSESFRNEQHVLYMDSFVIEWLSTKSTKYF